MWCVRRRPTLPHSCGCSTIGAGGLSFRVRNVAGRFPSAVAAETVVNVSPRMGVLVQSCTVDACTPWWGHVCGQVLGLLVPVGSNLLLGFHVRPINPVVWLGALTLDGVGDLILKQASRLDAFSGYPSRTWLTSRAPGGTTGTPEVRPSRSSRTRDSPSQVSCARGG